MSADGSGPMGARTIDVFQLKERCLELLRELAETGGEIVVTINGRPVSRLVPYRDKTGSENDGTKRPKPFYGMYRDKIEILGDIVSPMPPEWFTDPVTPGGEQSC